MRNTQYVWLVRYGKTEFPLVEYDGPYNSDIDPNEGIEHATAIAKEISSSPTEFIPDKVYCSPFLRTTHTAAILGKALAKNINVEDGLYEWLFPSLLIDRSGTRTYPEKVSQLKERFDNIDTSYRSCNIIQKDDFPEDETKLISRCRNTFEGILQHAAGDNLAIVSHAPCVQALAFIMEGGDSTDESTLVKWPLGGITRFSRDIINDREEKYGDWSMDFYGVTKHMPGDYKIGAGLWSLPCFQK